MSSLTSANAYRPGESTLGGPSAEEQPEPARPAERRIIGTGPLVLSRTALSFWERFKALPDTRHADFARAVDRETATILAQFKLNLAELGTFASWWDAPLVKKGHAPVIRLKPGVPELLLRGLLLDLRHLKALLQQLPVMTEVREKAFVQALEAMGRVEVLKREGEDMGRVSEVMKADVAKAVERRGIDLTKAVSNADKEALAKDIGASPHSAYKAIIDLREERGIEVDMKSWERAPRTSVNGHAAPTGKPAEKPLENALPVAPEADQPAVTSTSPTTPADLLPDYWRKSLTVLLGMGNVTVPLAPEHLYQAAEAEIQRLRQEIVEADGHSSVWQEQALTANETIERLERELEAERDAAKAVLQPLAIFADPFRESGEEESMSEILERVINKANKAGNLESDLAMMKADLEQVTEGRDAHFADYRKLQEQYEPCREALFALQRLYVKVAGGGIPPKDPDMMEAAIRAAIERPTDTTPESPLTRLMLAAGRIENGQREAIIRAACEIVEGRAAA